MFKALSTNVLVNHAAYPKILTEFNARMTRDGKVNAKKFYEEIVVKEIPGYAMGSWYFFLKRFKTSMGLQPAKVVSHSEAKLLPDGLVAETALSETLLSNHDATQRAIALALNLSADALKKMIDDPTSVSLEKRAELFIKVMKAQDSRVKAVGALRADNREQERFDRMMDNAAFNG